MASMFGSLSSFMWFFPLFTVQNKTVFDGLLWNTRFVGKTRQPDFPEYTPLAIITNDAKLCE